MLPNLTGPGTTTGKKIRLIFHCLYAGWGPVTDTRLVAAGLKSNIWDNCLVLRQGDWFLKFLAQEFHLMRKIKDKDKRNLYTTILSHQYKVHWQYDPRDPLIIINLSVDNWTFDLRHPEKGLQPPQK